MTVTKSVSKWPDGACRNMTFTKQNAAERGFNLWAINDKVFPSQSMNAMYHLRQGKRYRIRMRNASDGGTRACDEGNSAVPLREKMAPVSFAEIGAGNGIQ
jgi:hypothetical protein